MALNPRRVGTTYPPQAFVLDADRVSAFADAVGHPGGGVPPTFVTAAEFATLAGVVSDPDLGLDYARVVHGQQEYEWGRPLVVGEALSAATTVEAIRSRGDLEFLTLRTELLDESGRVVVVARSTMIVRGGE
ncbi:MAG TPA: MaoC family dehydratase N-terminal domain-containing protein [Actinomycetota bacterium]